MLETDSLQFGFKDKTGTADAIFTMKSTITHFMLCSKNGHFVFLVITSANIYPFQNSFTDRFQKNCLSSYNSNFNITLILLLHYFVKFENSQ